ncbi:Pkinase-domain-containing protein [Rhizophagus irregularis]|nr:Pkinase-domain-containing protein [Rhizophagus irregularis]
MVTFTTDYWAPALDSKARRRTESEERAARVTRERSLSSKRNKELSIVDITNPSKSPFNNDLNKSKTIDDSKLALSNLKIPSAPTSNDSIIVNPSISSNDNLSIDSIKSNTTSISLNQSKSSINNDLHKKKSLVQKLFHHDSKGENKPIVSSPTEEKGEFTFGSTASDKLSLLKEILNPTLDLDNDNQTQKSDSGSESGINKYGVCEKGCIGKGATAVVRLSHKFDNSDCERTYAVKEFRKRRKNETEKDYVKKLTSEFCISSTLQHVNVVRTVDLVQDENQNWCEVMEYCAGGDLYTAIKSNFMSPIEINCCFKQLIMGIDYLHSNGVAHRDIKPENLLLDKNGHLKITDFGVSDVFKTCWEEGAHLSRGICGSEPYIAPEQFESKEYDARKVDIWACGIVYYTLVYQGIPFRMAVPNDPNYASYLEKRNNRDYLPFEKLPQGCRELMYNILEPNSRKRITIEGIKQDPWFKSIESCSDTPLKQLKQTHQHICPEILKEIQNVTTTEEVNNRGIDSKK